YQNLINKRKEAEKQAEKLESQILATLESNKANLQSKIADLTEQLTHSQGDFEQAKRAADAYVVRMQQGAQATLSERSAVAQGIYVVLQECEHHRRSFEEATFDAEVRTCANEKLAEVKAAYDEFGGSATYWETLEKEVDEVVLPQYVAAAREMNDLESSNFHI